MKKTLWDNVNIPSYALSAIENNDFSGVDESDKTSINKWLETLTQNVRAEFPGAGLVFNTRGEDFFCKSPAFGLPSSCYECEINVLFN